MEGGGDTKMEFHNPQDGMTASNPSWFLQGPQVPHRATQHFTFMHHASGHWILS